MSQSQAQTGDWNRDRDEEVKESGEEYHEQLKVE